MTQFRKPLLAGVCAALVAGSMSASTASAQTPAKKMQKYVKDHLDRFYRAVIPGSKKIEEYGDKSREYWDKFSGLPKVAQKYMKKGIEKGRGKVRKLANRQSSNPSPSTSLQPDSRRNPYRLAAPIFGRPLRYNPKYINPDGSRMTQQQRLRVKTVPPLFIRDLEKSRRANVYRPQRIVPISMPKGVLMRLGIDPKTYRRGSTSKSLLDRIRSRSS